MLLTKRWQYGKWFPLAFFSDKILETETPSHLKTALYECNMVCIPLKEHDDLFIEVLPKSVLVAGKPKRTWFIYFTLGRDQQATATTDIGQREFKKVLQKSWDLYESGSLTQANDNITVDDEDEDDDSIVDGSTVRSLQETPTRASQISPETVISSPSVLQENSDLLSLFQTMINPKYLNQPDLFQNKYAESSKAIVSELMDFAGKLSNEETSMHYQRQVELFRDDTTDTNVTSSLDDKLKKIDPENFPFLTRQCGLPLTSQSMKDLTASLLEISKEVPEVLKLNKNTGSKGQGRHLVLIRLSENTKRLYNNASEWLSEIVSIHDNEDMNTYDIVHTLIRVLRSLNIEAFEDVAILHSTNESWKSKAKLDPEIQMAMIIKAGLKIHQIRTIKSYLCYANLDILQPYYEIVSGY